MFQKKNESDQDSYDLGELLETFNLSDLLEEHEFDIKERHIYETEDTLLKIELTEDKDLILSDEDGSIFINKEQVKHLMDTLKHFNLI